MAGAIHGSFTTGRRRGDPRKLRAFGVARVDRPTNHSRNGETTMHRTILILFLLAATFTAGATEPQTKRVTTGFSGACQAATPADAALLQNDPLWSLNRGAVPAVVNCSPAIDTSQNGAHAFGVTFSNTRTAPVTVTCTARISTAGPGGPRNVARSVTVAARGHAGITWSVLDLGEGKTFIGGQVGFRCALLPGVALSNVWTQSVAN